MSTSRRKKQRGKKGNTEVKQMMSVPGSLTKTEENKIFAYEEGSLTYREKKKAFYIRQLSEGGEKKEHLIIRGEE